MKDAFIEAKFARQDGNLEYARNLCLWALEILETDHVPESPKLCPALCRLARVCAQERDRLLARAWKIVENHPEEPQMKAETLQTTARILCRDDLFQQALLLQEQLNGTRSEQAFRCRWLWSIRYIQAEDLPKAIATLKPLVVLARETDYHQLGEFLSALADSLERSDQRAEATAARAEATEFWRRRYPEFTKPETPLA